MKNFILIISILIINTLNSQNEVHQSKVEVQEINGISVYQLNGENFTGFIYSSYPDNQLKSKTQIRNGVKDGLSQEYYNMGQLKTLTNYKEGKKVGDYKMYYENGKLLEEFTYKNDKINGFYKEYYNNGQFYKLPFF